MPLVIDDSSFPPPTTLPAFASLSNGDVYRNALSPDYFRKVNASTAYSFSVNDFVTVPDGAVEVQPVSAQLVITAP